MTGGRYREIRGAEGTAGNKSIERRACVKPARAAGDPEAWMRRKGHEQIGEERE